MKKRLTALLLSLCMVLAIIPVSVRAETSPNIKIGDYIQMGKYNGNSVLWRCVDIDSNGPLMLSDKVIATLAYDAKTSDNSRTKSHSRNYKRDTYGSNYWKDSNMRSWLNSTAEAGKVDWLCGNAPKVGYVSDDGAYDAQAGFLNAFSKAEIAAMKTVTQHSLVSHPEYNNGVIDGDANSDLYYYDNIEEVAYNFDSSYFENTTEKMFLLDVKQVNSVWKNLKSYYKGYNYNGMAWPYWLRTPVTDCNHDMRYVASSGSIGRYAPWYSSLGVRPAFYLDSDYFVATSGSGTQSNPYVGSAPNKQEDDYSVSEPIEDPNQDWNVSTTQKIELTLGNLYSADGKYANSTVPVYTIQKTRSDLENMVVVICGEGYTKSQQGKFINDVKRIWNGAMQYEPYRSYADRFNVYALCTASESTFDSDGSTFFDVVVGSSGYVNISNNVTGSICKNHIFERCIGPEFIEQIHDAHIKNTTDPNDLSTVEKEYEPYYYVNNYITQFALIVNTSRDFGGSSTNYKSGFHYFISPSDSYRAPKTFAHEFGHGLFILGDEYLTSTVAMPEQSDNESLNLTSVADPEKIKWKQLHGFRNTYTCMNSYNSKIYVASYECLMRDTNYQFCEVCRLQGVKRMSQFVDEPKLYVATPEVKEYTEEYSKPSDFESRETSAYYTYTSNRNNRLLSGSSKSRFGTGMKGKKIELRTVIQNLSEKTARRVKLKMWIKHSDGSVAVDSSGNLLETVQNFDISAWSEKPNFWAKGAMDYTGIDFDSGLKNCSLIYQIPSDANLATGDTVAFQVLDENGKVLADDNTETQSYANVSVNYKFEDGSEIPNTAGGTVPVPIGQTIDWTPPKSLYGYELVKTEGLNETPTANDASVTYYFRNQDETPSPVISTVSLSLESSITMNFKVLKNSLASYDNYYVNFKCGDKEINVSDCTEQGSYYVFSYKGISPQLMNDDVKAVLHAKSSSEEYTSPEKVMSVKTYAYTMLNKYGNDDSYSKLRTLLVDLLNYGAAAQEYIGYQSDNLVNSELTSTQKSWGSADTTEFNNIRNYGYKTVDNPKSEWKGSGLVLSNAVTVRAKFTAENVDNKTVEITCKDAKFTYTKDDFVKNSDGTYYVYCDKLYANEMSDEIYLTVYENGVQCGNTMRFSIESYARLVRDNYKGKALDKMTTAMMLYGKSAKAYGA